MIELVPWGSSPHTRGARVHVAQDGRQKRIIPAYAGSTWWRRRRIRGLGDHPRIRGEHYRDITEGLEATGSSPHTRGALRQQRLPRPGSGIIPAYAGSTRRPESATGCVPDHPRIRGEHCRRPTSQALRRGSSPHTRGARLWAIWRHIFSPDHPRIRGEHLSGSRREFQKKGIIPAYAGSTPRDDAGRLGSRDHPRIRGEHILGEKSRHEKEGSSPHTRGARPDGVAGHADLRIIPAYAGSTPRPARRGEGPGRIIPAYAGSTAPLTTATSTRTDHPRIRGEHCSGRRPMVSEGGSSPHTRGALVDGGGLLRAGRIIPAYAGSTAGGIHGRRCGGDHPRIRGEHEGAGERIPERCGSSPHTRGALTKLLFLNKFTLDHPRIRGEHPSPPTPTRRAAGSSPHTRGARNDSSCHTGSGGIIPAYAGSTCPG